MAFPYPSASLQSFSDSSSPSDSGHCSKLRKQQEVCGTTVINGSHSWESGPTTGNQETQSVSCSAHVDLQVHFCLLIKVTLQRKKQNYFNSVDNFAAHMKSFSCLISSKHRSHRLQKGFVTELAAFCCCFSLSVLNYCNLLYCQVQEPPLSQTDNIRQGRMKLKCTYFFNLKRKNKKNVLSKVSEMDSQNVLKASLDTFKPDLWFQKVSNSS